MKILFMGTTDFAVSCLDAMRQAGYEAEAVVTKTDKPKNRGMKLQFSAVKEYALQNDIPVYQPETLKTEDAQEALRAYGADLFVVVAYGKLLPKAVLDMPRLGCINVHASLLPKYRGAAPINRAILEGETETGVTIMHMAKECDTGDMILQRKMTIDPDMNAEELFAALAALGADAISDAIRAIENGTAARTKQDDSLATYAPMLSRELSPIDWTKSMEQVFNQIRGLVDWPCATMELGGATLKLFKAVRGGGSKELPGKMKATKQGIEVTCGDGKCLTVTELQAEGGKRMAASAYLNGKRIAAGAYLN